MRIGALVLLAFALRAVWPLADPARRLSWSSGLYTDPASVVHSARNAVLFGEWVRDENRDLVFYPLLNWLTWLVYQVLGPGRLGTQWLAAALGGGISGDHCSPISDSTIVASMASATDHIDHVRTQLPYALISASRALVLFLIFGFIM